MSDSNNSNNWESLWGVLLILFSALGFSAKSIFVKLAYLENPDSILILTLRMLFSLPFFILGIYLKRDRLPSESLLYGKIISLGVLGYYFASIFDFYGLETIPAGLERMILFSYPTLVVLISAFFKKRKIQKIEISSLILTYGGILLIFIGDATYREPDFLQGSLWVFMAAISYAGYLVGSDTMIDKLGGMLFSSLSMTVAIITIYFHFSAIRSTEILFSQSTHIYSLTFLMAIFSTVLPVFLLTQGIQRIGSGRAAIVGSIGPVSTIYMSQIFLDEKIRFTEVLGSVLIISGVLLTSTQKKTSLKSGET